MFKIIEFLASILISFVIWDIYLKPVIQDLIKERLEPFIKQRDIKEKLKPISEDIFDFIDMFMPIWLKEKTAEEIVVKIGDAVRSHNLIEEKDLPRAVKHIIDVYDPLVNADKLKRNIFNAR